MKRKTPVTIVVCFVLWYAAMLMLPEVADIHGVLAFPVSVRQGLKAIAAECATFEQARNRIRDWDRHWIDHDRKNRYVLALSPKDDGGWTLVATPEKAAVYHYPLWKRLLLLDFYQHVCPTYTTMSGASDIAVVHR